LGNFLKFQVRGNDIPFRYGGEEFLIILSRISLDECRERAEKLREDVKKIDRLQVLIPLLDKQPKGITLAQVIFRDISLWNQSIVIDKGTSHGIEKDMVVISNQGLVGRVLAASHSTAHVILLTDFHSRVSCQSHESRDVGILCGEITKQLRVKYLDLNSTIKVGDTIISSGIGGIYSKGIPIGKVTMVGTDDDGLHLYALVDPFVKFSKLEEVLCLERTIKEQDFFSLPS